jgi:ParB-like chromosome segregation protein Spo0J
VPHDENNEFSSDGSEFSGRSTRVPIGDLRTDLQIRAGGVDAQHVQRLAETFSELPPILVHAPTMRIVDGLHRLAIAKERGATHVQVQFTDGSDFDVIAMAVRSNVTHGLPLSLEDRRIAVRRLLCMRPEWSDRRLGRTTGVSPGLVSKIRSTLVAGSSASASASAVRVGLDGKARPLSASEGRLRVAAHLAERPEAPVREVAAAAGVSVATVQDVRNRLNRGIDPLPERVQQQRRQRDAATFDAVAPDAFHPAAGRPVEGSPRRHCDSVPLPSTRPGRAGAPPSERRAEVAGLREFDEFLHALRGDPSVRSTDAGRQLLRLLATDRMSLHALSRLASCVPPHRVETVASLARSLSGAWGQLARELDQQQRHPVVASGTGGRTKVLLAATSTAGC